MGLGGQYVSFELPVLCVCGGGLGKGQQRGVIWCDTNARRVMLQKKRHVDDNSWTESEEGERKEGEKEERERDQKDGR